jgi:peptide deformylase
MVMSLGNLVENREKDIGGKKLAVRKIVTYPAEILEEPCETVSEFDKKLVKLLNDMYDTMIEFDGVGLAAPQIGIKKRIAVVDIDDENGTIELINPEIIETEGEQTGPEGCLSFPGLYGEVTRPFTVKIKAQDRKGKSFTLEADDFLARAIQHEIDHLDGVLFTSKVNRYLEEEELEGLESE